MKAAVSAAALAAAFALSACADQQGGPISSVFGASGDTAVVEGVMVLPEGETPPGTARAEARIVDVTRSSADGGAFLVATDIVDAQLAPSIPFRMQWRPGTLEPGNEYVVHGRIYGRSGRLYETTQPVTISPAMDRQQVTLALTPLPGAAAAEAEALKGEYSLEGVPDVTKTSEMPMTSTGEDVESLYGDEPGYGYGQDGDSFSDYMLDTYGDDGSTGRVISPE